MASSNLTTDLFFTKENRVSESGLLPKFEQVVHTVVLRDLFFHRGWYRVLTVGCLSLSCMEALAAVLLWGEN